MACEGIAKAELSNNKIDSVVKLWSITKKTIFINLLIATVDSYSGNKDP
jgi:hypothetical protein